MSQGRWTKYSRINPKILEIIRRSASHLTTNEIKSILDNDHNIRVSWPTLNKYLSELQTKGHIEGIKVEKQNTIYIWKQVNINARSRK